MLNPNYGQKGDLKMAVKPMTKTQLISALADEKKVNNDKIDKITGIFLRFFIIQIFSSCYNITLCNNITLISQVIK